MLLERAKRSFFAVAAALKGKGQIQKAVAVSRFCSYKIM